MCQHSTSAIDFQCLTRPFKLGLTLAFVVLVLVSVGVCQISVAASATGHVRRFISRPPSVVFIGDSITAIWGTGQEGPEFAEHPNWIDKGVIGQNSNQVLARFQTDVIDLHPEIVHILVGTNDVYPGWTLGPSEVPLVFLNAIDSPANVETMVQVAQANDIHVVLATIPPWGCNASNCTLAQTADPTSSRYDRINIWNAWIEEYALSQAIPVVDYHSALLAPDRELKLLCEQIKFPYHAVGNGNDIPRSQARSLGWWHRDWAFLGG